MTKKIFKSIGLIALAVAVAIGSFFVPISKKDTSYLASADSTTVNSVSFLSSDIIYSRISNSMYRETSFVDLLALNADNPLQTADYEFFKWNFQLKVDFNSANVPEVSFYITGSNYSSVYTYINPTATSAELCYVSSYSLDNVSETSFKYSNIIKVGNQSNSNSYRYTMIGSAFYVPSSLINSDNSLNVYPTLIMDSIELGNYTDFDFPDNFTLPAYYSYSNIICYTDTNGFKFFFFIPTWYKFDTQPQSYLTYRKYYTANNASLSENQIYLQGYNQGLLDNQSNIYDNGYLTGYENGYENGKTTGAIEANDYSFFGFFGAIFDAPVTLFTSLLNFDFLGINLWSFVTSLLTLAIILFVVKLFIRR